LDGEKLGNIIAQRSLAASIRRNIELQSWRVTRELADAGEAFGSSGESSLRRC